MGGPTVLQQVMDHTDWGRLLFRPLDSGALGDVVSVIRSDDYPNGNGYIYRFTLISSILRPQGAQGSGMRLLCIQPGAIGDFVVALPSMVWLKQKFRPEWFEIWSERVTVPLVEGLANHAMALDDVGIRRYPVPERFVERLLAFDTV